MRAKKVPTGDNSGSLYLRDFVWNCRWGLDLRGSVAWICLGLRGFALKKKVHLFGYVLICLGLEDVFAGA